MKKIATTPEVLVYPSPTVLVGAMVDGKPNFLTICACSVVNHDPPKLSVTIKNNRYSKRGMLQNMVFSVNVPSSDMVRETDYCGIVSGADVNKVEVCKFKVFYGKLESAPLIEQCPINLECRVVHVLDMGTHSLFIGRVEGSYISEDCQTDGMPDIDKIKPLAWTRRPTHQYYYTLGETVAKSFSIGLELREK